MAKTFFDKAEEMLNGPAPEMPYKKGEVIKSGEVARTWTGPKPWAGLRNKSTRGSAPFSNAELKQGYRKVK